MLRRIVELGDKKHSVTPRTCRPVDRRRLKTPGEQLVRIEHYAAHSSSDGLPKAQVSGARARQARVEASSTGDGGYDAFMKALAKALRGSDIKLPQLVDYKTRIPPGGKTGALVETVISWQLSPRAQPFSTLGVDSDQLAAAVTATEKMLNLVAARRTARL